MNYNEVLAAARGNIGPYCKACPVCNGVACKNQIPGPGAKGNGDVAIRNYNKWQEIRVNMDTLCENITPDTTFEFSGRKLRLPVFAGPVGAVKLHYGEKYTDEEYNDILLHGCKEAGILGLTGDGTNPAVMEAAAKAIKKYDDCGIPTIKPWNYDIIMEKLELVKDTGFPAVAMDIDAAGLPFLKNLTPPAGSKTVEELYDIVEKFEENQKGLILKGIMTVSGAEKAMEAGAWGIVVSNHGGRVLDGTPATAEVLPEIVEAVDHNIWVFVDGGIRTGLDIFKALAMGADAVIIARPYVTAVYGGGVEGVKAYTDKLQAELSDVMAMCGAATLDDININMLRHPDLEKYQHHIDIYSLDGPPLFDE